MNVVLSRSHLSRSHLRTMLAFAIALCAAIPSPGVAQDLFLNNGSSIYIKDQAGTMGQSSFVFGDSSNRLNLGAGGTTRMTITPTGNVGLGTQFPADKLDLAIGNQIIHNGGVIYFRDQTGTLSQSMFVFGDSSNRLNLGSGNATRISISSGGNVGIGTTSPGALLHVAGNAQVDGNIGAKYQDIAEWVTAADNPPPGTVVVLDPSTSNRVVSASRPYDFRVAGVVSSKPGIILGHKAADEVQIAHSGRVKVKVDAQYGPIAVGDLLVTSPTPGHAMRSTPIEVAGTLVHRPGTLLGKALEPLAQGQQEILILLMLQ